MSTDTAALPTLDRDGEVFVLHLGDGENRFNPAWVQAVEEHLAAVEQADAPRALVTTATGKFWSNGLDLDYLGAHQDELAGFVDRVHRLFAAVLGAGFPTVAAVGGHAFAAGAMLAVCHDQVVMRADRGYWCVPEVNLRLPFTPGMTALLRERLPMATAREAMLTARRYGGAEAVEAGIADVAVDADAVQPTAVDRARSLAHHDGPTLATIKARLHAPALEALAAHQPVG